MESTSFMRVDEVAQELGISKSYAYKIVQKLNVELKEKGFMTISGRVNKQYFMERTTNRQKTGSLYRSRWRCSIRHSLAHHPQCYPRQSHIPDPPQRTTHRVCSGCRILLCTLTCIGQ